MEHNNCVLNLDNVSKTIKNKTLLHPLSQQIGKGRILALCGGNGAGKSTLIRLIVGVMSPTTGTISINGKLKTKHKSQFVNQLGYMPDDFRFQPSLTAKETIHFYAKLKRIKVDRVNDVLSEVGLLREQDKTMGTFSKGMNQRMLLAQALLTRPPVLILDEPTNGLDPYWVNRFEDLMTQAKNSGQTVVFSTHDLHVAEKIADDIIFLSDGKVISQGPIDDYEDISLYETFQQLYFKMIEQSC